MDGAGRRRLELRAAHAARGRDSRLDTVPATTPDSVLVAELDGRRHELLPGAEVRTAAGVLRYDGLAGWMGYRIFHDPTIMPLLFLSLLGVAGLAWHLWKRSSRLAPALQASAA